MVVFCKTDNVAQSMRCSLWVRAGAILSSISSFALVKIVLESLLDKELTANCLVKTRTKFENLVLAAMVNYGLYRV